MDAVRVLFRVILPLLFALLIITVIRRVAPERPEIEMVSVAFKFQDGVLNEIVLANVGDSPVSEEEVVVYTSGGEYRYPFRVKVAPDSYGYLELSDRAGSVLERAVLVEVYVDGRLVARRVLEGG